tara:strand:- start:52 stop:1125 length:1074 start_codon:yes stop_codon:yes gene_type:complete
MREKLKADESSYRQVTKKIIFQPIKDFDNNSKVIAEFYRVYKEFKENGKPLKILNGLNLRIKRGDRIGIIGKNGSGKTTFLKLILNHLSPDQGSIKINKNMEFSYFDQNRSDLKPNDRLKDVMAPNGGDYVEVRGKMRHIYGYLKDFMFDSSVILESVSTLSGGQKNRLKLAKILANPKSCLILDEPTNDLDMETLDMLCEILMNYQGTLLLVSHDRDFLDQIVTKILSFEGDGVIEECIGGYSDYIISKLSKNNQNIKGKEEKYKNNNLRQKIEFEEPQIKNKLTFKLEFELKNLPSKIKSIEEQINLFNKKLSDPNFYKKDTDSFIEMTKKLELAKEDLEYYETRWLELEEKKRH